MNTRALVLAGAISLPLGQTGDWQLLAFNDIIPNQVSFGPSGMTVDVEASASPVIYPLERSRRVSRVEVSGSLSDLLSLETDRQGYGANDDFSLKIGLVVAGDKTLGGIQKLLSPDWVRTLFELAPEGKGISNIHFLNAVQDDRLLGLQRQHPLSELIYENNVWLLERPGAFTFSYQLDQPREVVAVWISIDGDNSGSRFSTLIKSLKLEG